MTHISTLHSNCTPNPRAMTTKPVSLLARIAHLLRTQDQRAALTRLDDARLHDIGVTRQEANAESKRALWDVPSNWRN